MNLHRTALKFALVIFLLSELGGAFDVIEYGHSTALYFIKPGNAFFASAALGAFLFFLRAKKSTVELAAGCALGFAAEIVMTMWRGRSGTILGTAQSVGVGLAVGGAVVTAVQAIRLRGQERTQRLDTLAEMAMLPVFILLSSFFLHFTVLLHPTVLDPQAFAAEMGLGADTGFRFARWVQTSTNFTWTLIIIYVELPLAVALVYAAEKARARHDGDVLTAFVSVGFFGYLCYHLCPVIGPRFFFENDWPRHAPNVAKLVLAPAYNAPNELRNCIPSLHTSWALMLYWHARPQNKAIRVFGAVFLALTLMSTVGLGWHYLIDLIIAFPFSLAVRAAFRSTVSWKNRARSEAFAFGVVGTLLWIALIRGAAPSLAAHGWISAGMAALSVGGAWLLELRLLKVAESLPAGLFVGDADAVDRGGLAQDAKPGAVVTARLPWGLLAAFTFSGFAGLVYEVVFAKELAHTFGSTSKASTTVLATYMGGLALGSYIGARFGEKRKAQALRIYVLCEAGVGILCAVSPSVFRFVRGLYVSLAAGSDTQSPWLTVLQLALGAIALLPPTILMGMTMPALAIHLNRQRESLGRSVGLLYGANTLGAAAGALLAGYVLLPMYHVRGTTWIATGLNFGAAAIGFLLERLARRAPEPTAEEDASAAEGTRDVRLTRAALLVLGVGGLVTLALETTYIHLLAVVAGNSAYAFSLMLFAFLLGLGGGSAAGRAWLARGYSVRVGMIGCQALVAISVLGGVFLWNAIPHYFGSFYNFGYTDKFAPREFIRFIVCAGAMLPVASAIGASYPIVMEALSLSDPKRKLLWMGRGMALNTAGNILGALLGTFVLLPVFESLRSLHVLAAVSLGLGIYVYFATEKREHYRVLGPVLAGGALFVVQPSQLDLTTLSTGANVYFHAQPWGTVLDHAESADGGLTAVAESRRGDKRVLTLLTNGKFQGDDDPDGEMRAQLGFALVPLIHTEHRGSALVIGLGTGVSSRTVHDAQFADIEVAELSRDVARLAHTHFGPVNSRVLDAPNVKTLITDGRNHLMLSKKSYDLVTIELSSIWFAGAASLYNREFYELVDQRLAKEGVLQQWIQLHRISTLDIAYVLGTVRSVFPRVWLYFVGNQGIIVACRHDCQPTLPAIRKVNQTPSLSAALGFFDGRAENVLPDRILDTDAIDAYVAGISEGRGAVSTDDNLFLEYSTPRGNVRPYKESLDENVDALRSYEPEDSLRSTKLSPGDVELPHE